MIVSFFVILFCLICITYQKHKCVLHPFFITGAIWFVLMLSYEIFAIHYPKIPHLSYLAFLYIALYLIVFFIVSELVIKKRTRIKRNKLLNAPKILNGRVIFLFYFVFLCNLLLILRFCILTGSFNPFVVIYKFRQFAADGGWTMPLDMKLLVYIYNLTFVLLLYDSLYKPTIKSSLRIAVVLEFCIILLFIATKGKLFKYIIAVFVLLYVKNKLTPKNLFYFFIIGLGSVVLMIFVRDSAFFKVGYYSLTDYIYIYALTPFPSLDLLIHGHVPFTTEPVGGRTLVFFYRILNVFTHIELPDDRPGTMFITVQGPNVVVPTNVFTGLGNFYMDWRWMGIVFYAVLCSLLFSILYKNINRRFFLFVYVLTIFSLVFNFFGDFCFQFFSMTIQDIVAVLVVFSFRKVRKPIKV